MAAGQSRHSRAERHPAPASIHLRPASHCGSRRRRPSARRPSARRPSARRPSAQRARAWQRRYGSGCSWPCSAASGWRWCSLRRLLWLPICTFCGSGGPGPESSTASAATKRWVSWGEKGLRCWRALLARVAASNMACRKRRCAPLQTTRTYVAVFFFFFLLLLHASLLRAGRARA